MENRQTDSCVLEGMINSAAGYGCIKIMLKVDCFALQPVVHYTFIPLIIVLGMRFTEPRPTIAQLLGPM